MRHALLAAAQRRCGVALGGALVGAGAWAAASNEAAADVEQPLLRFGVIADIQYCDCEDASNFAGTETRRYRGTLPQTRAAVAHWNALTQPAPAFVVNMGDLIDGQNAGKYGAGLQFESPQSDVAFGRVATALSPCVADVFHAIGNHELCTPHHPPRARVRATHGCTRARHRPRVAASRADAAFRLRTVLTRCPPRTSADNFGWDGLISRLQRDARPQYGQRSSWHVAPHTATTAVSTAACITTTPAASPASTTTATAAAAASAETGAGAAPSGPPTGGAIQAFSWRPKAGGWTFVMLNAYAVSLEQDPSLPGYALTLTPHGTPP
jgi:hypothetical protein